MSNITTGIFFESLDLFMKMSPYLIFGFFFAGLLHVFISLESIAKHLGKNNLMSVLKAVIFGIPLPLCSCGVIPAAMLLKKKGASKASVVSFLIATPITGIDSIFATVSLLGPLFAIYRVLASSITAFVAGAITVFLPHHDVPKLQKETGGEKHRCCDDSCGSGFHVCKGKVHELFYYAFIELLGDIWKWLMIGIIIGGAISYFIPASIIQTYLGSTWQAMPVMLIIGIPMYVCSTGSIPIAAALMLKGMSPGAALVFLLAGPATNAMTITVVAKELGRTASLIYVLSIAVMSILSGMLLNVIWDDIGGISPHALMTMEMLPKWLEGASAAVLALLILFVALRRLRR